MNYTSEERAAHREHAEKLLRRAAGMPFLVARQLMKKFGIGKGRARRLVMKILDEWALASKPTETERNRAQAIRRVRDQIHHATYETKERQDGQLEEHLRREPNYSAIAKLEQILMRLEGTDQPLKVSHEHGLAEATQRSVAQLTAEEIVEMMDRRREEQRLVGLARARLPEAAVLPPRAS